MCRSPGQRMYRLLIPLLFSLSLWLINATYLTFADYAEVSEAETPTVLLPTATGLSGGAVPQFEGKAFDPFPSTLTMTTTIATVVAALAELPQPPLPPEGALLGAELPVPATMNDISNEPAAITPVTTYRVYLPLIRKIGPLTPTLDPPTVTPSSTLTATPTRTSTATPEPTMTPQPPVSGSVADVAVTIWPAPSIRVARNNTLAYEIRLANYGRGTATKVHVTLPYYRQQFVLTHSRLDHDKGDWVSAVTQNTITVTFGALEAGQRRSGTLYVRVLDHLADNTVISMRANYRWSDRCDGGAGASNWAPILVGSGDATSPWVWLAVEPVRGQVGTTHRFFTDRFIPEEGIVTWLNTPGGVRALPMRAIADRDGRVWLQYSSRDLVPGTYQLVVYGARSNLTAVGTFIVE